MYRVFPLDGDLRRRVDGCTTIRMCVCVWVCVCVCVCVCVGGVCVCVEAQLCADKHVVVPSC